jgi:hypothetical protein
MDQPAQPPLDLRRHHYLIEIEAKVLVRSSRDPEQLCADIYSRISEHVRRDEDILDLGVEAFTLPDESSGSSD